MSSLPNLQVDEFAPIGDRQFVSFVQFFLHKCGEITLDNLWIKSETKGKDGPAIVETEYHFPIKNFKNKNKNKNKK
jgi:hypothetical protein